MYADLVHAPGFDIGFHEAEVFKLLYHLVVGHRCLSPLVDDNGSGAGFTWRDRGVYDPRGRSQVAVYQRRVYFFYFPLFELGAEVLVRLLGFGKTNDSARFLIQPVYREYLAVFVLKPGEQVGLVSVKSVGNGEEISRFVYNDQVIVFVYNLYFFFAQCLVRGDVFN